MRIIKLIQSMVDKLGVLNDRQYKMIEQLKEINTNLDGGIGKLKINPNSVSITSKFDIIDSEMQNLVQTKDVPQLIEDEVKFLEERQIIKDKNPKLYDFCEQYCKYKDKYELLSVVKEIKLTYHLNDEIDEGKH